RPRVSAIVKVTVVDRPVSPYSQLRSHALRRVQLDLDREGPGRRELALVNEAHHLLVVGKNQGEGCAVLAELKDSELVVHVTGLEEKPDRFSPILVDVLHDQGQQAAQGTDHRPNQARDQRRVVHDSSSGRDGYSPQVA